MERRELLRGAPRHARDHLGQAHERGGGALLVVDQRAALAQRARVAREAAALAREGGGRRHEAASCMAAPSAQLSPAASCHPQPTHHHTRPPPTCASSAFATLNSARPRSPDTAPSLSSFSTTRSAWRGEGARVGAERRCGRHLPRHTRGHAGVYPLHALTPPPLAPTSRAPARRTARLVATSASRISSATSLARRSSPSSPGTSTDGARRPTAAFLFHRGCGAGRGGRRSGRERAQLQGSERQAHGSARSSVGWGAGGAAAVRAPPSSRA